MEERMREDHSGEALGERQSGGAMRKVRKGGPFGKLYF